MSKTLVVVESPTKAKTIKKYLGAGYEVLASKGHIKDLPKKLGIDVEHGFTGELPSPSRGRRRSSPSIKGAAAKNSDQILLIATDPDREGEAIAVHIARGALVARSKSDPIGCEFHEITASAGCKQR